MTGSLEARSVRVRGVVQGVGFRPFVFRLARANQLAGWVLNEEHGVDIHLEGADTSIAMFLRELSGAPPPAARIAGIDVAPCEPAGCVDFEIRESQRTGHPSTRISPDLPVCAECLAELRDPRDPRHAYPYINCTNCGPRYSIIEALPYDRAATTMKAWPLDAFCAAQYADPRDRRFHAQPVACAACGPGYHLQGAAGGIPRAAELLRAGQILAVKGIGGFHLVCDARHAGAVQALRLRKFRKEKPFAVMAADLAVARTLVALTPQAEALLQSTGRPIVLAPARIALPHIAPGNHELGVMLPYAPLHYLLFDAGAPSVLVMTSANRSSEPIAYRDEEARHSLAGIADGFLIGERPIARRVDDSVARAGAFGPMLLRRSRGYAPGAVAMLPTHQPVLALGADLKNSITLVADGQAFVSQHIGDVEHYESLTAFHQTIRDLLGMYQINTGALLLAHDAHPQYATSLAALELPCLRRVAVQHHRAHLASVLAEREAWDQPVIGVSFDGTGYGDDGSIWGGEFFYGSLRQGFERVAHLRPANLPGGDAAARYPVQCAAGFLAHIDTPDLAREPFGFPARYQQSQQLLKARVRTFQTTSAGRLFDAAAALLGFTRESSFEGQAATWVEALARTAKVDDAYPLPLDGAELDFRPLLSAMLHDRLSARPIAAIARAFQRGVAKGTGLAIQSLCRAHRVNTVVLSGGVFQNELLLEDLRDLLDRGVEVLVNSAVPPNDGGISLGQAAIAAMGAAHA